MRNNPTIEEYLDNIMDLRQAICRHTYYFASVVKAKYALLLVREEERRVLAARRA